jgi:hypothetical protein
VTALATGLLLVAGPAYADEVPDGWESSHVSLLQALTVFVFAPLGVALVIVLLVAAPWLRRGEGLGGDPEARHRAEPEESPELTAGPGEEPRRRLES